MRVSSANLHPKRARARRLLAFIACSAALLGALRALAQVSDAPRPALVVWVQVQDSALTGEAIRSAIAEQLGVRVASKLGPKVVGTLDVEVEGAAVKLNFRDVAGGQVQRSAELPDKPERALEVIALLAHNLARDEAGELLQSLQPAVVGSLPSADERTPGARTSEPPAETSVREARNEPATTSPLPPPTKPSVNARSSTAQDAVEPKREPGTWPDVATKDWKPVNLSFAHPLALYPDSHERSLGLELGLVYSSVGQIEGAAVNPLVLRNARGLRGAQLAGIYSEIGSGETVGAHAAGAVAVGHGPIHGVELAGIGALRFGAVVGAQLGGIISMSDELIGMQASGLVSLSRGDAIGAQLGMFNFAQDEFQGAQIGAFNVARSGEGLQLAAGNVARAHGGLQIGVVNVARHAGALQLGIVNISDEIEGYPIGLVNVSRSLRIQPLLWTAGSRLPVNAGVRYLKGPLYTLLALGFNTDEQRDVFAPGVGLGGRLNLGPVFFDADVLYQAEMVARGSGDNLHVTRGRASVGVYMIDDIAAFVGGGPLFEVDESGSTEHEAHYFAGIQLF